MMEIDEAITTKGVYVCEQFFKAGFGGTENIPAPFAVAMKQRIRASLLARPQDIGYAVSYETAH